MLFRLVLILALLALAGCAERASTGCHRDLLPPLHDIDCGAGLLD